MKKTSLIILSVIPFLSGCNNVQQPDLMWINREYNIASTIEINFIDFENFVEEKEDFILYIYSPSCMSCNDFDPILKRYITDTSVMIYSMQAKNVPDYIRYKSTPAIQFYNDGVLETSIDHLNDEKIFSSYENFSLYMNQEINIMKTMKIKDENQLFNIIKNKKNAIIYYHYDMCPDCAFFDENYLKDYIKSDTCVEFYTFDVEEKFVNRESKDDPLWTDFTKQIGIHSSCDKGYKNGVIPSLVRYENGSVKDVCIIFNDELKETIDENDEVISVSVVSSYYSDSPFVGNTYFATKDKSARNVYKENTIEFYKEKFLDFFQEVEYA